MDHQDRLAEDPVAKVFHVVELVELILENVPAHQILKVENTCKLFHELIRGSPRLKQVLWQVPNTKEDSNTKDDRGLWVLDGDYEDWGISTGRAAREAIENPKAEHITLPRAFTPYVFNPMLTRIQFCDPLFRCYRGPFVGLIATLFREYRNDPEAEVDFCVFRFSHMELENKKIKPTSTCLSMQLCAPPIKEIRIPIFGSDDSSLPVYGIVRTKIVTNDTGVTFGELLDATKRGMRDLCDSVGGVVLPGGVLVDYSENRFLRCYVDEMR